MSLKLLLLTGIIVLMEGCIQNQQVNDNPENRLSEAEFYHLVNIKFDSIRTYKDEDQSTEILHQRFADTLTKYKSLIFQLHQCPDSCKVNFIRSRDSLLITASWDDCSGGTMIMAKSIAFYKTETGIKVLPQYTEENKGELASGDFYTDIYSVKSGTGVIYLAQGFSRGSSSLPGEGVKAFQIIHDSLIYPAIFPESFRDKNDYNYQTEATGNTPKLSSSFGFGFGFDLHHCNDSFYTQRPVTLFQQEGKILKVPKVNDKGGNTKYYYTLEFNGKQFVVKSP